MDFKEAIKIALQSLWANKLRSVLTLLGVVLGVGALILVATLIEGLNRYVAEKVFNLGADVIIVSKQPTVITNIDMLIEARKRKEILYDDNQWIASE
jgi:putative ABC transport system permease protein